MSAAFQVNAFQNNAFQTSGAAPALAAPVDPGGVGITAVGALDFAFDPITRDLIDQADGSYVASTDSRTAVLLQLESTYLAWWGDPFSGSRIRAMLAGEEPATINDVRDEVLRALQPLVADAILSDLSVAVDFDEAGRSALLITYTDRASGRPVDIAYVPFGG